MARRLVGSSVRRCGLPLTGVLLTSVLLAGCAPTYRPDQLLTAIE